MADVTVTPANVLLSEGNPSAPKNCIAAIEIGEVLYLDDNKEFGLASSAAAGSALIAGSNGLFIALNKTLAVGQPVSVAEPGSKVAFGAGVLVVGTFYVVSPTAGGGKMKPISELVSTDYVNVIGYAETTSILVIQNTITGLQKP